jgi:hypothetical protein
MADEQPDRENPDDDGRREESPEERVRRLLLTDGQIPEDLPPEALNRLADVIRGGSTTELSDAIELERIKAQREAAGDDVMQMRDALRRLEDATRATREPIDAAISSQIDWGRRVRQEQIDRDEVQNRQLDSLRTQAGVLEKIRGGADASAKRQWLIITFAAIGALIGLASLILSILVVVGVIST